MKLRFREPRIDWSVSVASESKMNLVKAPFYMGHAVWPVTLGTQILLNRALLAVSIKYHGAVLSGTALNMDWISERLTNSRLMAETFDWEKVCVSKFCTVCADFVNYEKTGQETGSIFLKIYEFFLTIHPLWWSNLMNFLEWFFVKGMKVCQALLQRSPCCEDFLKKSDGGLLRGTGYESLCLTHKIWILSYES